VNQVDLVLTTDIGQFVFFVDSNSELLVLQSFVGWRWNIDMRWEMGRERSRAIYASSEEFSTWTED
jgi:hypothetical protein